MEPSPVKVQSIADVTHVSDPGAAGGTQAAAGLRGSSPQAAPIVKQKKEAGVGIIRWLKLVKDIIFSLAKCFIFYDLVLWLWPFDFSAPVPQVMSVADFFSLSTGYSLISYGDWIMVNVYLVWIVWYLARAVMYSCQCCCFDNDPNELVPVTVNDSFTHKQLLNVDQGRLTDYQAGFKRNSKSVAMLILCHDKLNKLSNYSSFSLAIIQVNDFITLKSISSTCVRAREGVGHMTCRGFFEMLFWFIVEVTAFPFALLVIAFKMYFWAVSIVAITKDATDVSISANLTSVRFFVNILVIVFDILSLASLDYYILMNDFYLARANEGKEHRMIEVIASNRKWSWYLRDFVYKHNYIKLQHLIKISVWAQTKDKLIQASPSMEA